MSGWHAGEPPFSFPGAVFVVRVMRENEANILIDSSFFWAANLMKESAERGLRIFLRAMTNDPFVLKANRFQCIAFTAPRNVGLDVTKKQRFVEDSFERLDH